MLEVLKLACETFKNDSSSPSVTFSWLSDQDRWYVSFVRYTEPWGQGKRVVCSVINADFTAACEELAGRIKEEVLSECDNDNAADA